MSKKLFVTIGLLILLCFNQARANSGYKLWLAYNKIADQHKAAKYKYQLHFLKFSASSPQLEAARTELLKGLDEMFDLKPQGTAQIVAGRTLVVGTIEQLKISSAIPDIIAGKIGAEGYLIKTLMIGGKQCTVITAQTDVG